MHERVKGTIRSLIFRECREEYGYAVCRQSPEWITVQKEDKEDNFVVILMALQVKKPETNISMYDIPLVRE